MAELLETISYAEGARRGRPMAIFSGALHHSATLRGESRAASFFSGIFL
jgi:hypothetical protein